jgi:hypothetical protein
MNVTILLILMLLPGAVLNGTDCHYVEFNDHFEAICVGDERYEAISQALAMGQLPVPPTNQNGTKDAADLMTPMAPLDYSVSTTSTTVPSMASQPDQAKTAPHLEMQKPVEATAEATALNLRTPIPVADAMSRTYPVKSDMPSMYRPPRSILETVKQRNSHE